jgi:ZIP family zinc transporter
MSSESMAATNRTGARVGWLYALVPIGLLALTLGVIVTTGAGLRDNGAPPIEALAIQRVTLPEPGLIELSVINDGPDPVTIAQVMVDDAYWSYTQEPAGEIGRRGRATFTIPYPWVEGETTAITLLSSTGVAFGADIPVAIESPHLDRQSVLRYGLIGVYVGIIPVTLGLLWYPILRRLGRKWMNFILALTVGLLLFLVIDMFQEAQEVAADAPVTFDAPVLVPLLAVLTAGLLVTFSRWLRTRGDRLRTQSDGSLMLAYQIALGIGLHNLGEGLAIGSAFSIGEAALGVFLIVGFTLHNVTEGIGVAAPLVENRPPLRHFVALALLAGGPAVLGTWIGAFTFSSFWTAIFLAIGVGAIVQVIYEVGRLVWRSQAKAGEPGLTWTTFGGLAAGIAVMYVTALIVA